MNMFKGPPKADTSALDAARKDAKAKQLELERQQQDMARRRGNAMLYSGSALGFPTLGSAASLGGTAA